ncbi:hypothetical protein RD792_007853 [Penstemon davidsonii]|uniref:CASP-like protein n=1 Tax=Penstemon davidsonii TaxID=160366 RepID=A0ABR0D7P3_9LAMI|nr:hypothetical protein RD792_007853 [Penstemon davidsonii]
MIFSKRFAVFVLRFLALGASISATAIMITSRETVEVLNIKFEAKYTNTPTFVYFVLMNAIASGYSLILLFFPAKNKFGHFILVLDLIMVLLLDSSISACLAIGQVAKKGNSHAGWLPICGQVHKFCDHAAIAVAAGFVASILYFIIVLYSIHNVMNLFTLKN